MNTNVEFLNCFFNLLNITRIEILQSSNEKIKGFVGWEDDDKDAIQEFVWNIPKTPLNLGRLIQLINYLADYKYVENDKIIISQDTLVDCLMKDGWSREQEIIDAINQLCSVKIDMIDNDEPTDSFFVHF